MLDCKTLEELVNIDSPSGYTEEASVYIYDLLKSYGWKPEFTNKGAVRCALGNAPQLVIAAHVDTLGGIVTGIKSDGTLSMSPIGGPSLNAYEGSYLRVCTMDGKHYNGTLLLNNPATHVNKELGNTKREIATMHVRLDEVVTSKTETEALGIRVGDFICFETHYTEYKSGFIKSKFMDNKAGCLVLFELARIAQEKGWNVPVELYFSNYEEVGHGGTGGYAETADEMLVIDMGVVGDGCEGKETHCSICAKDSSGPYDYGFRKKLVQLAEANEIPYKLDVYPYYGSDGSAALRAGKDLRVGLIGPGVSASHGVERTHKQGIQATIDLCLAYIEDRFLND